MVLSATRTDFKPMQSPEFMVCCFCNKPTKALSASLVQARFAHPECYAKHVKARSKEFPAARKATPPRWERTMKVRAILWTVTVAYTGFLLTGQGLRTFNSLSITVRIPRSFDRISPCCHVHSSPEATTKATDYSRGGPISVIAMRSRRDSGRCERLKRRASLL
jgi:hypothetical protein